MSTEASQYLEPVGQEESSPTPVWRRILVPMDFSVPSEAAFAYALKLAALNGAEMHVCHIIPVPHVLDAFYEHGFAQPESVKRIAQKARKRVKELAAESDIVSRIHFGEGEALDGVLEQAAKLKPDLIVIGTHGRRGAKRFFLGSVAEGVVRRASCPVLTLRSTGDPRRQESKKG